MKRVQLSDIPLLDLFLKIGASTVYQLERIMIPNPIRQLYKSKKAMIDNADSV